MKTPEQQLVDLFHKYSVERFNHTEFARLLSEQDHSTQKTFYYCMSAFIAYKAGFAENFLDTLDPDSLAMWCYEMDNFRLQREQEINFKSPQYNEMI